MQAAGKRLTEYDYFSETSRFARSKSQRITEVASTFLTLATKISCVLAVLILLGSSALGQDQTRATDDGATDDSAVTTDDSAIASQESEPSAVDQLKAVYEEATAAKSHATIDELLQHCEALRSSDAAKDLSEKQRSQLAELMSWAYQQQGDYLLDEASESYVVEQQFLRIAEETEQPISGETPNEDAEDSEATMPESDALNATEVSDDGSSKLTFGAPTNGEATAEDSAAPVTATEQANIAADDHINQPLANVSPPRPAATGQELALAGTTTSDEDKLAETFSSERDKSAAELIELAINAFSNSIRENATNWQAYHGRGVAESMQGRYEDAIASFQKSVELNPDHLTGKFNLAECLQTVGKFEEAIVAYSELIQKNPQDAAYHNGRGQAHAQLSQLEDALVDFKICAQLEPQNARAILNRGEVYQQLGEWEEAIRDFNTARSLSPRMYEPTQRLAWLMGTCPDVLYRNEAAAYELSVLCIRLKGKLDAECLDTLAAAQAANGWYDDAVQTLEQAEEMYPDSISDQTRRRKTTYQAKKPFHVQASRYR